MQAVVKRNNTDPVKIGIGTERQEKALKKLGCRHVFFPRELRRVLDEKQLPTHMFLRPEDTIIMLQPTLLTLDWFRKIIAAGVSWQVPGHEVVRFKTEEDRKAWRKLKPKGQTKKLVVETRGRKASVWPAPTPQQITSIVTLWHSPQKRAEVVSQVRSLVGAEVPDWWVRDVVIKATGSAKRTPE